MSHRMPTGENTSRRALGRRGEALAEELLRARGARILARNLHMRHAEIDLVALDGDVLCVVEVRLRSSRSRGTAAESVDARKRRRLAWAARELLASYSLPRFAHLRFDVIAIDASSDPPRLEHVRDAFATDQI
jgi:putative endonuclease